MKTSTFASEIRALDLQKAAVKAEQDGVDFDYIDAGHAQVLIVGDRAGVVFNAVAGWGDYRNNVVTFDRGGELDLAVEFGAAWGDYRDSVVAFDRGGELDLAVEFGVL